ncbi:hypothetical protein PUN28_010647 [Cardiocondyla obscurior]|uniref:Uncharacterized protein n=1 Tax=Cardiocondyla obscurior TaxID=286306 RepID=A0AAW2FIV3_9HYME
MSTATGQLTPSAAVVKRTNNESKEKYSVVKQNPLAIRGQGCDAVSPRSRRTHPLALPRVPSQSRISPTPIHSYFSSPTQTQIYYRGTRRRRRRPRPLRLPSAPLMPRHVLSNTYTRIKIQTVNPNKYSAACTCARA